MWENEQQWKLQFSTQLLSQTPVSPTETVTQQRLNRCSYLNQVFSGEKRQANVFHQVSQVFLPDVFVVVDPSYHSLKNLQSEVHRHTVNHIWYNCLFTLPYLIYRAGCVCACVCACVCVCVYLLLCGDGELVAGDQTGYLLHPQIEELFTPDHLSEMLLCREKKNTTL